MPYPDLKLLIAGEWTDGSSGRSEPVICPADGSTIGTLPHASPADLDAALQTGVHVASHCPASYWPQIWS